MGTAAPMDPSSAGEHAGPASLADRLSAVFAGDAGNQGPEQRPSAADAPEEGPVPSLRSAREAADRAGALQGRGASLSPSDLLAPASRAGGGSRTASRPTRVVRAVASPPQPPARHAPEGRGWTAQVEGTTRREGPHGGARVPSPAGAAPRGAPANTGLPLRELPPVAIPVAEAAEPDEGGPSLATASHVRRVVDQAVQCSDGQVPDAWSPAPEPSHAPADGAKGTSPEEGGKTGGGHTPALRWSPQWRVESVPPYMSAAPLAASRLPGWEEAATGRSTTRHRRRGERYAVSLRPGYSAVGATAAAAAPAGIGRLPLSPPGRAGSQLREGAPREAGLYHALHDRLRGLSASGRGRVRSDDEEEDEEDEEGGVVANGSRASPFPFDAASPISQLDE